MTRTKEFQIIITEIAPVVRRYADAVAAPLDARLKVLEERRRLVGGVKSESGVLILTMSDGSTVDTGIRDGKDASPVDLDQLRALVAELVDERIEAALDKRDQESRLIKSALINDRGWLVATFSDGSVKEVGHVVGTDGEDGAPGRDGFSLDDLVIDHDGERRLTIKFVRGELVVARELVIPTIIDRGAYEIGKAYERGDAVTYGGSLFIAQRDAAAGERPEESGGAWRLAVKRGRDGKDGAK